MNEMNKIKRRRYLVDKPFQYRYMSLVAIPLVFLLAGLYYLIYYSVFSEMLIPEAIAVTLLPAMKKVNIVVAFALPVILFLIIRASLVYSNRIIGPIPRIERQLDKAIAGDYSIRLKTRDKDELGDFISKINTLLEKIEESKPGQR
ncbi:MAG: methyl-accepting chemotaxis protein [Candidatus Omnitrophota bacterium]